MEEFLKYIYVNGYRMDTEFNGLRPEQFLWKKDGRTVSYEQLIIAYKMYVKSKLDSFDPYSKDTEPIEDLYEPAPSLQKEYSKAKYDLLLSLINNEKENFHKKHAIVPNGVLLYDHDIYLLRVHMGLLLSSYELEVAGLLVVPCQGIHYLGKPRVIYI